MCERYSEMRIVCFVRYLKWPICFSLFAMACLFALPSMESSIAGAAATLPKSEFKVTTVYLVRHAEKAAAPAADPPLLEAGNKRAQELARTLGNAGIKAIFTSQFLR